MSGKSKFAPYSKEQLQFLRDNVKGRYYHELAQLFNAHFGCDIKSDTIGTVCRAHGMRNELHLHGRKVSRPYSEEQIQFLRDNIMGRSYKELTEMFNRMFGTSIIVKNLGDVCSYHGLSNGLKGGYKPGHKTNVGRKCSNAKPDGAERIDALGYRKVKQNGVWKHKHVAIWEEANGKPVPDGSYIMFADGNRDNMCPDNLFCVTPNQLLIWAKRGLKGETSELAAFGVTIAGLFAKINERQMNLRARKRKINDEVDTRIKYV